MNEIKPHQYELFPDEKAPRTGGHYIIGLAGRAGAGKDTAARRFMNRWGYRQYSFAQPLRDGLKAMFDMSDIEFGPDHKESPILNEVTFHSARFLMQTLGTEWGRNVVQTDIWLRVAEHRINQFKSPYVVISDVRFPNEAEWISRKGGIVLWVERDRDNMLSSEAAQHVSESMIESGDADGVIDNNGTVAQLNTEVDEWVAAMGWRLRNYV